MKISKKILSVFLILTLIATSVFSFAEIVGTTPDNAEGSFVSVADWENMVLDSMEKETVPEEVTATNVPNPTTGGNNSLEGMIIGEKPNSKVDFETPVINIIPQLPVVKYPNSEPQVVYPDYSDVYMDDYSYYEIPVVIKPTVTIQFTSDLSNKYPVYKDTGIEADFDTMMIDKKNVIDFIDYIVTSNKIKATYDKSTVTIVKKEKPVAFTLTDKMSVSDFENIFKETAVAVKVVKSRAGGKYNFAEYLEFNKSAKIIVNGNELSLTIEPVIVDSVVLLPIKDIAIALKAEVSWDEAKREATIKKGDKTLVYKPDSVIVSNGKQVELSAASQIESARLLVPVQFLINELGASVHWDALQLMLVIASN